MCRRLHKEGRRRTAKGLVQVALVCLVAGEGVGRGEGEVRMRGGRGRYKVDIAAADVKQKSGGTSPTGRRGTNTAEPSLPAASWCSGEKVKASEYPGGPGERGVLGEWGGLEGDGVAAVVMRGGGRWA